MVIQVMDSKTFKKKTQTQKQSLNKTQTQTQSFPKDVMNESNVKGWKERMEKLWKKDQLQDMKQAITRTQKIPWAENSWRMGEHQEVIIIHAYVHTQLSLFLRISLQQGSLARWTLDLNL